MFEVIKPCGLDVTMASMKDVLKVEMDLNEVKDAFVRQFNDVFIGK